MKQEPKNMDAKDFLIKMRTYYNTEDDNIICRKVKYELKNEKKLEAILDFTKYTLEELIECFVYAFCYKINKTFVMNVKDVLKERKIQEKKNKKKEREQKIKNDRRRSE